MVSVSKLSLQYGDGVLTGDQGAWIKTMHRISWFSWNAEAFHRTMLHPVSNLPEIIINERSLERLQMSFFTRTLSTISSHWNGKSEGTSHVLLSKVTNNDEPPELVDKADKQEYAWRDEDDYLHGFTLDDVPCYRCGDKLLCI